MYGNEFLILLSFIIFIEIFLLILLVQRNINIFELFFNMWLSSQVTFAALYFLFAGNFFYFNPILGKVNLFESFIIVASVSVLLKSTILFFKRRNKKDYSEQLIFFRNSVAKYPLFRWIAVGIWPLYIVDIFLGHTFLQLPISLFISNLGGLVIIVPFLSKGYRFMFWITLIGAFPLALAMGSRGPLMFPLVLYFLGAAIRNNFSKAFLIKYMSLIILGILMSSLLGVARYAGRYGGDQSFVGLMSNILDAAINIVSKETNILIFSFNIFADRITQWPIFVALQEFLEKGMLLRNSWIDELLFSFSVSGTTNSSYEMQTKILDSGMLYGMVKYLGYEPSVGWTIPVNMFVEVSARFGSVGFMIIVLSFSFALGCIGIKRRSIFQNILILALPGMILFRIPETHSVYLFKQIIYIFMLCTIVIVCEKLLPKYQKTL